MIDGATAVRPVLFGFDTSTYTQILRLVLAEKGVACDYVQVADWSGYRKRVDYGELHPFSMVPVFDHAGLRIYESLAIARYIDAAFGDPPLQPADPLSLARMHQIISIHDNYARRPWVSVIAAQRNFVRLLGAVADEAAIARVLPDAVRAAEALDVLLAERPGDNVDLADLYLVPATAFFSETAEGAEIIASCPGLRDWWQVMRNRRSVADLLEAVEAEAPDNR
jgi:glutathione S-transferase